MGFEQVLDGMRVAADYWLVTDRFAGIEGYLDPIEGYALLLLAEHGPGAGMIVEIGSFAGRSTAYLAYGSMRARREKVVAVDHFKGSPEHKPGGDFESARVVEGDLYETFTRNLAQAGVDSWVRVIRADSEQAGASWSHPIRLLFIDGDHSKEASRRDFELWKPWLVPEGLVAFHDIGIFPGVTAFYEELQAEGAFAEVLSAGTLRVVSLSAKS